MTGALRVMVMWTVSYKQSTSIVFVVLFGLSFNITKPHFFLGQA